MTQVWLIGTGYMAKEYARVLRSMRVEYLVVGRSKKNCDSFAAEFGCECVSGGLETFLTTNQAIPSHAIVAVGVEALSDTCSRLLRYGVKKILLEKPGIAFPSEAGPLAQLARSSNAKVVLGYNRRFYSSVIKAKELIEQDGGADSFAFEFTEWSHVIDTKGNPALLQNWFISNSSHVADTAFYLGGAPEEISCYWKGGTSWHPAASVFVGAGKSVTGALFSYHANWEAPGRWVVEVMTKKRRFIFRPMEKLQVQELGSVEIKPVTLDDKLDVDFKPGLFLQTQAFLENQVTTFCDLHEQESMISKFYCAMSNYKPVS